nr:hypothetical protein CFP56_31210 [Quercus suber]
MQGNAISKNTTKIWVKFPSQNRMAVCLFVIPQNPFLFRHCPQNLRRRLVLDLLADDGDQALVVSVTDNDEGTVYQHRPSFGGGVVDFGLEAKECIKINVPKLDLLHLSHIVNMQGNAISKNTTKIWVKFPSQNRMAVCLFVIPQNPFLFRHCPQNLRRRLVLDLLADDGDQALVVSVTDNDEGTVYQHRPSFGGGGSSVRTSKPKRHWRINPLRLWSVVADTEVELDDEVIGFMGLGSWVSDRRGHQR